MLIAYIIIETEPQIGQFLQAALLLPAGKRPKKAKKPDCVPIWWLSGHITAKKSQIWLDISQISSTFERAALLLCSTRLLREPSGARLLSALVCNLGQEPLTTPTHHNPKNPLGHAPNGAAAAAPPSRGRRRFAPPTLSQIIRLFICSGGRRRNRASEVEVGLLEPPSLLLAGSWQPVAGSW